MGRVSQAAILIAFLLTIVPFSAAWCDSQALYMAAATTESADEAGLTIETAVVLEDATNEFNGVSAEHAYTNGHYPGWKWKMQSLMNNGNKQYDIIELVGPKGESKTIYFDITNWFGKLQ